MLLWNRLVSTISDIASLAEVRKAIEELREYLRSSKERMQEDDDEDDIQVHSVMPLQNVSPQL